METIGYYRFRKKYKIMMDVVNDYAIFNIQFRSFEMRSKWELYIKLKSNVITFNKNKPLQQIYTLDYFTLIEFLNLFVNFLWEYRMIIPNIDYKKLGGMFMMEKLK